MVVHTTGLQQQLVVLVETKVTVVVGTVVLVLEATGTYEVLVTVNVSLSVIVSDIDAVSVTVSVSVRMISIVSVVKGPVGTVSVVTMGDPARHRAHWVLLQSAELISLRKSPPNSPGA
jgi:hypothetical protein